MQCYWDYFLFCRTEHNLDLTICHMRLKKKSKLEKKSPWHCLSKVCHLKPFCYYDFHFDLHLWPSTVFFCILRHLAVLSI